MEITKEKQLADLGRLIAKAEAVADDWWTDDSGVHPHDKNYLLGIVNTLCDMKEYLERGGNEEE
jgi:hypothetical protein